MRHSFRSPSVENVSANWSKSIHQYFCHFFENFNPAIDLKRWKSCTLDKCKCIQKFNSNERICMKSRSTLKIHHVNPGTYTVYGLEKCIRNGKPKRGEQIFIKKSITLIFKWHKAFDVVIAFDLSLSIRFRFLWSLYASRWFSVFRVRKRW